MKVILPFFDCLLMTSIAWPILTSDLTVAFLALTHLWKLWINLDTGLDSCGVMVRVQLTMLTFSMQATSSLSLLI